LSETEEFLARLQALNRIQIPVEISLRFEFEPGEVLFVEMETDREAEEASFYARLQKGLRFTVPQEIVMRLGLKRGDMIWVKLWK